MSNNELLIQSLKRNRKSYDAFLILIAALECMMMVYGLVSFDFLEFRRRLYFACYVLLLCCTVAAFVLNRFCLRSGSHPHLQCSNAYLYTGVLIVWSAVISALDLSGGGYPITYMTILAAVGSLVALPPVLYGCVAVLSSAGMIALARSMGCSELGGPFYLNYGIFLLVAVAVEVRNFHTLRSQYLLERRLEEQASLDGLTQVSNRRSLDTYMARLVREGTGFTFTLLDLDHFKAINDTYGHPEGDLSLMKVASTLKELMGEHVFRYGGDEFAVISFEAPDRVCGKLSQVNRKLKEEAGAYTLQICAGVYARQSRDNERRIFEQADCALYAAKQSGGARIVLSGAPNREAEGARENGV